MNKYAAISIVLGIILILFVLIGCILESNYLAGQKESEQDKTLWGVISHNMGKVTGFLNNQVSFVIGLGDREGDFAFCPFGKGGLNKIFFSLLWSFASLGIGITIWIWIFVIISELPGYLGIGSLFPGLFSAKEAIKETVTDTFKKYFWEGIMIILIFIIAGYIPVLNRFIQIITFEFLGVNLIIRSLIFAALIYFFPIYWGRYQRYRKRSEYYKRQLREETGREILRTLVRS